LTLIETSQKLLWYHPDAEQIFKQAESIFFSKIKFLFFAHFFLFAEILAKPDNIEINPLQISQLIDLGFTEQQAENALKRTKLEKKKFFFFKEFEFLSFKI